jgi:serine/threonine protein kinase HipA of HipAB toxin-antitoxin module
MDPNLLMALVTVLAQHQASQNLWLVDQQDQVLTAVASLDQQLTAPGHWLAVVGPALWLLLVLVGAALVGHQMASLAVSVLSDDVTLPVQLVDRRSS